MGSGDEFLKLHGTTARSFSVGSRARAAECAVLDLVSSGKGLLFPRMTTAQRHAVPSPLDGLVVYDTDEKSLYIYAMGTWVALDARAGIFVPADTTNVLTGFAAYIASDGKAYETDASIPEMSYLAGVDIGLPDILQAFGQVEVRFSSISAPVPGQVVYLARGDDELSNQSRGKFTVIPPAYRPIPSGVVLTVPANYATERKATILLQPCACSVLHDAPRQRTGVALVGAINKVNQVFTTPTHFVHEVEGRSIQVYYNGQRLFAPDDYVPSESGGLGAGYDTVTLQGTKPPKPGDRLWADYWSR